MANDNNDVPQDKPNQAPTRVSKKDVDLFPALLIDRKTVPMLVPRSERTTNGGPQISMFVPNTFDEALDIVECLRGRAATTICLEKMRRGDANRLVDFVAGASAAIDGDFHKLSEQVYIFCPSNVRIVAPGKETPSMRSDSNSRPLDFLYPERSRLDKSAYSNLWSKT